MIKDINQMFNDFLEGKPNLKDFEQYQVQQEIKELKNKIIIMENTQNAGEQNSTESVGVTETQEDKKVRFSQSTTGDIYIRQGKQEISFSLVSSDEEQLREVINGMANILSSLSAHLYDRVRSVEEMRERRYISFSGKEAN
jgi:hypothetical protein